MLYRVHTVQINSLGRQFSLYLDFSLIKSKKFMIIGSNRTFHFQMEFFDICYFSDYIFDAFILERPLYLQTQLLLLFKKYFYS